MKLKLIEKIKKIKIIIITIMDKIFSYINKQGVRNYIALGFVVFTLTYLYIISFIKIPINNKEIVHLSFGWVTGATTMILGYFFGSTKKES
jgi:hypothetical protein